MRKSCAWSVPGPASPRARVRSWTIEKHDLSRSALAAATQRVAWDQILIVYPAALSSLIIENPIASIDSGMALYPNPSMFEGRAPSLFTRQHTLRLPRRARNSFLRSTSANVSWSALYARSEERRVGKECRYRWWPYNL